MHVLGHQACDRRASDTHKRPVPPPHTLPSLPAGLRGNGSVHIRVHMAEET